MHLLALSSPPRLRSLAIAAAVTLLAPILLTTACAVGDDTDNSFDPFNSDTIPDGPDIDYYATVDVGSPEVLRATLHEVIDDHKWHYYTHSSQLDLWDMLETAQEDPDDPERIVEIYRNASLPRWNAGNDDYDREHTWPKSLGFPRNLKYNYPYTDGHHLMLADGDYNSARANKPYGNCTDTCEEWPTVANGEHEGTVEGRPETSNWTSGYFVNGVWDVWIGRRGDVARAMFYMDVRYEGGTHGVTERMEPDLILTDDLDLIVSNTSVNRTEAHMGHLSTLIEWHQQDPVSEDERFRNNVIQAFQGNRNPFIDHPEWVECIFLAECGGERPAFTPWINELHYDNASTDEGEGLEIAGAAGTNLAGYTVVAYNGSNGEMYKSVTPTGTIPDQGGGAGAVWFDVPSLQNGSPDGLVLVDSSGEIIQMFAYEGSFTAVDGPAMGLLLSDIGMAETAVTPIGTSLQMVGTGCAHADFTWADGKAGTPDSANDGQAFSCL